jgi:hypothetical protein
MKVGIEMSIITDTHNGKKGIRVFPYWDGSDKAKTVFVTTTIIILFASSVFMLSCATPDPIIQPTVTLLP